MFLGIAGLGIGFVIGWTWESLHRRRRSKRLKPESTIEVVGAPTTQPRFRLLQTKTKRAGASDVVGSRLTSVTFLSRTVEFDFSGVAIETEGLPVVSSGSERHAYPEVDSRDALCRLIGTTVKRMRISDSNEVHLTFDDGSDLALFPRVLPRVESSV